MSQNLKQVCLEKSSWPALPTQCQEGIGGQVSGVLYAGLGTAGNAWYGLDSNIQSKKWVQLATFPFSPVKGAVSVTVGTKIYLFGGVAYDEKMKCMQQVASCYCYHTDCDLWQKLQISLPIGLLGASAVSIDEGKILFFGGYNREQFNQYSIECEKTPLEIRHVVVENYMNRISADFLWNNQVLQLDLADFSWRMLGRVDHDANCGSSVCKFGDEIHLISGEIKPGLRTSKVKSATLREGGLTWTRGSKLPSVFGLEQEGIAGSFAGKWGNFLICAGGTNFPGSLKKYMEGQYYAHAGLKKTWRSEVYVFHQDQWSLLGMLPNGRAYGLTFEVEDGTLFVGGDGQDGHPCLDSIFLPHAYAKNLSQMNSYLKELRSVDENSRISPSTI